MVKGNMKAKSSKGHGGGGAAKGGHQQKQKPFARKSQPQQPKIKKTIAKGKKNATVIAKASNKTTGDEPMETFTSSEFKGTAPPDFKKRKQFGGKQKYVKKNMEMITEAKKVWEKLRVKEMDKDERQKLMTKMMQIIKGKVQEIIFKHDASRFIQTCIKYGSESQRQQIIGELKGRFVELAKNHYAHFLVNKALKYSKEKHVILKEFSGHFFELTKHKEAYPVVEYIWNDVANALEKSHMLSEFYGTEFALFKSPEKQTLGDILKRSPEKKDSILSALSENINAIFDKGAPVIRNPFVHKLLLEYFSHATVKGIRGMIDTIKETLVEIIHSKEGAQVGVHCVSYGDAKDRKVIVKGMKGYVTRVCMEEYGHLVILRILDVTDDTIFLSKSLLPDIKKDLKQLILDKYGHLCLLHILAPKDKKYFSQFALSLLQPTLVPNEENPTEMIRTSKKTDEIRQEELLQFMSDDLISCCLENADDFLASRFGVHVFFETASKAKGDKAALLNALVQCIIKDTTLLTDISTSRLIKQLLKEDSSFDILLADALENKHEWAAKKGSSFVILALLECSETSAKVKKELLPHLASIKQQTSIPGVEQILELLSTK